MMTKKLEPIEEQRVKRIKRIYEYIIQNITAEREVAASLTQTYFRLEREDHDDFTPP